MNSVACVVAALLVTAACSPADGTRQRRWSVVGEALPVGLLSVWGRAADDVYVVGSDDGTGPTVLHYDGGGWRRIAVPARGDLWWVHGRDDGTVVAVGEGGLMLVLDGDTAERVDTSSDATLFGAWSAAVDDVWVVGGRPRTGPAFVGRGDANGVTGVSELPPSLAVAPTLFKVFGRNARDVWMVGAEGATVHYDGDTFVHTLPVTRASLLTVHFAEQDVPRWIAVGGSNEGVLLELDPEGRWQPSTLPERTPPLLGVHVGAEKAVAVGHELTVLSRRGDGWEREDPGVRGNLQLHGVWIDPDGGVWAVGGQVLTPPLRAGVILHEGTNHVAEVEPW